MKTKHIAMWACPRSRSTAITRAFDMSYHLLPGFDRSWLSKVKNFFLIRNPRETVLSYWKATTARGLVWEKWKSRVGWEEHYQLFKEIEDLTQEKPLVIDSGDLVKNPRNYLKVLCSKLGVDFYEKMLYWEPKKTKVLSWKNTTFEKFSEKVISSTGFFQEFQEAINIPDILEPYINICMLLK